jgi:glycerophosphoryl diester phosphodiesterase
LFLDAISDMAEFDSQSAISPWLGGLDLRSFPGPSLGERVAQAASHLGAHILSPAAYCSVSRFANPADGASAEHNLFTTRAMVDEAHRLGMQVKPWTVNDLDVVATLVHEYGVDGIITDGILHTSVLSFFSFFLRVSSYSIS